MSLPLLECKYFTEEFVKESRNGNFNSLFAAPVPMLRFVYELCWNVVRGELTLSKFKAVLDGVKFFDGVSHDELGSCFVDVVTQMAQDITMSGDCRTRLVKLAKWLVESALVPLRHFHERCEEEFLWEALMIKIKAQDLKGKEVRVNTRLLYQQTKFNLLWEESEGYAKLVTLLCRGSEASTQYPATTIGIIKSLIGHFDLDPNRVFDIVLECFELQPDNNVFLQLIPIFPKSHASQILGFKFQYYQHSEVTSPTPLGLYKLTALLVREDFIDLDSIYAHLLPKDDEAFEHYKAFSAKRLDEANKIGKINLAATGKDLMEDEKQGDLTIDLFAAVDLDVGAVAEQSSEIEINQKLGLLIGFLSVDDWYHAHIMFYRLSPLNPVAHDQICEGLFRLIEKSICLPYDIVRQRHLQSLRSASLGGSDAMETNLLNCKTFVDIPKDLFQMLVTIGSYLYRDTLMLQKVCRVLRGYYLSALELVDASRGASLAETSTSVERNPHIHLKEARSRVEEALGACLLPSLQLIPANPAIGQEIWDLMSLLPYEARYRLYGEWEKDDERNPTLLAARQTAKLDTRRILKRLAKENLKQLGRMVAKLAHANPMTVLRTIVHQIEAYRDMITPVVDAFKYLTQLEYDILEYVVIERLAQAGRDKLKEDGLNLSDWLQSLASFWGHLCKKYPSMELRGLFQYLVNQLKRGVGIDLVLLQELVQQMANVQFTENLTEDQLDAMAGSETLRYQATSFGVTRNNKALVKSTNRLRDSLLPKDEPKLAIPLLLLVAQHRSVVLIKAEAPYIKMVSEQFDRCHGTLLQYVDYLCTAVTPAVAYAQLIPSLEDLIHMFHLDPEVAFLIYRPVMRLFKCQGSDVFWPLDDNEATKSNETSSDSEPKEDSTGVVLDLGSPRKPISWYDLLDTVKGMLPSKAWNSLSPNLYATFWGLSLYDIYVPKNRYESEIAKQHAALKALEEISDNSSSAIAKRKKDKERIQEALDRLTCELHKHEEHVTSVHRRLSREKDKWLSSCPDTLKINMEFLQRCIFPRCTFSMPDAIYCAMFVHTLHSLGTPFFNTVNHIDVLICKTLQPMICYCTEYEAGRLGRFLYETLKIAYHWKSDELIYERECGNMPGFAVYYRYPNSQRVTYGQFIKVHWKWSQRITRLLIQCLESSEFMEIRNSLIMLTKISSVFPVTRKSGINLEKRVAKIKSDDREDLKVLATSVAAALAARKSSWVTDEEFGMGYLDLKPAPAVTQKLVAGSMPLGESGPLVSVPQNEAIGGRPAALLNLQSDSMNMVKEQVPRMKFEGRLERVENAMHMKSDTKVRGTTAGNGSDLQSFGPVQAGIPRATENQKQSDESVNKMDENSKVSQRNFSETEKASGKRLPPTSMSKSQKQDVKDDGKVVKAAGKTSAVIGGDREPPHGQDNRQGAASVSSAVMSNGKDDGSEYPDGQRPPSRIIHSPRQDGSAVSLKSSDKMAKRTSSAEESDRLSKRRKGEADPKDAENDVRLQDRERSMDIRSVDLDRGGTEELTNYRVMEKPLDRPKEKGGERHERDHRERERERLDRSEKSCGDDTLAERARDRSMERHGIERSVERGSDRNLDRVSDKAKDERSKDDRSKLRYAETPTEKSHLDDRFYGQNLPPPPPLHLHMVPQSVSAGSRRDDDGDRRTASTRHTQRLSPRHDDKERRRSEENTSVSQDDAKRRKDDDIRDRKREEREVLSIKMEGRERGREKERDRERTVLSKEEMDLTTAKRRKLKREHMTAAEPGEFSPIAPPPPVTAVGVSQPYDARDRDRKGTLIQRAGYLEESGMRIHGKEAGNKLARRDVDPVYDRDWDDEKRQRAEQKRRHRK